MQAHTGNQLQHDRRSSFGDTPFQTKATRFFNHLWKDGVVLGNSHVMHHHWALKVQLYVACRFKQQDAIVRSSSREVLTKTSSPLLVTWSHRCSYNQTPAGLPSGSTR